MTNLAVLNIILYNTLDWVNSVQVFQDKLFFLILCVNTYNLVSSLKFSSVSSDSSSEVFGFINRPKLLRLNQCSKSVFLKRKGYFLIGLARKFIYFCRKMALVMLSCL